MANRVQAKRVRYIRLRRTKQLGRGVPALGHPANRVLDTRALRSLREQKWQALARAFEARGKSKSTVTSFVTQVRAIYEDDGETLWITFHTGRMHWTFIDPHEQPSVAPANGEGWLRRTLPWRSETIHGEPLWITALPGSLTKTAGFLGTSCELERPDDAIRRINAEAIPEVAATERILTDLQAAVVTLLHLLNWKDFELLVDLLFATSGCRRHSIVGEQQETSDIEIELPSTGERAFVQVKSATNQAELDDYRARFGGSTYDRMFFAYHRGDVHTTDPRITLLGPERLAKMIVEAGLVSWLLNKVR